MFKTLLFIFFFFFLKFRLIAETGQIELSKNFHIEERGQKQILKSTFLSKDLFAFDSVEIDHISFNPKYKVYFNNEWWNIFIDSRFSYESCIIGKKTKIGFQTFHLFAVSPNENTDWIEMHQESDNVSINCEFNNSTYIDLFYNVHIYQEVKRNSNDLFYCRTNDFSALFVYDCKNKSSKSLPILDGIFRVNDYSFNYFAYSSNRYYLLLENYKTLYSASASSNVNYSVWNDFILAEVGTMATFYQKKENNWNDWSDSLCKDSNFLIFYFKDKIECASKSNYLVSLKKSEFSDVFIVSDELIVIDSLKKAVQIYSAGSNEKFAYQLSKKYVFDREGKQLFINKRKRRVKRLNFENGKFEIENLSK